MTQVAGVAAAVSQIPTNTAAGLLGLTGSRPPTPTPARPVTSATATTGAPAVYRSPYRFSDGVLQLLDQRRIPEAADEQACRRGMDVAFHMRAGTVRGGPLLAQLGAYGLALTARELVERPPAQRESELRRVGRALVGARPGARMLAWVVEELHGLVEAARDEPTGHALAERLWGAADMLAQQAQEDHARIAQHLAAFLPRPTDRPLQVLIHGDPGALTAGLVGTAINGLMLRVAAGDPVHAWVTETRPEMEGARLATWELTHAGVEHTLLPDSAVATLLASESIDAVLLGAEWIAANGDVANVVGSRAVAELAAIVPAFPVPVIVCGPARTVDLATPDGTAIPADPRPVVRLGAYLSGVRVDRVAGLNPAADIVPAQRVSVLVTEQGVLATPEPDGLSAIAAIATGRGIATGRDIAAGPVGVSG